MMTVTGELEREESVVECVTWVCGVSPDIQTTSGSEWSGTASYYPLFRLLQVTMMMTMMMMMMISTAMLSVELSLVVKTGLGLGLLQISSAMYNCLVYYTGGRMVIMMMTMTTMIFTMMMLMMMMMIIGAVPAEHYSSKKRPEYKRYQEEVNMFFPGWRKIHKT